MAKTGTDSSASPYCSAASRRAWDLRASRDSADSSSAKLMRNTSERRRAKLGEELDLGGLGHAAPVHHHQRHVRALQGRARHFPVHRGHAVEVRRVDEHLAAPQPLGARCVAHHPGAHLGQVLEAGALGGEDGGGGAGGPVLAFTRERLAGQGVEQGGLARAGGAHQGHGEGGVLALQAAGVVLAQPLEPGRVGPEGGQGQRGGEQGLELVGVGQGVGRGVHGPQPRQGVRRCTVPSAGELPPAGIPGHSRQVTPQPGSLSSRLHARGVGECSSTSPRRRPSC